MRKIIISLIILTAGFFLAQKQFAPLESHAINGGDKVPSFLTGFTQASG